MGWGGEGVAASELGASAEPLLSDVLGVVCCVGKMDRNVLRCPQLEMIRHVGVQEQVPVLRRLFHHSCVQSIPLG